MSNKHTKVRFRLNPKTFSVERLVANRHQISMQSGLSYPTVLKYTGDDVDDIQVFSGEVLYGLLTHGLGLTPAQVADLRLGDVFEIS